MKERVTYKGIEFDSNEELYFYWWCEELKEKGVIADIITQPDSFPLSDRFDALCTKTLKTKSKDSSQILIREHVYTADVQVTWNEQYNGLFFYNINAVIAEYKYNSEVFKFFASIGSKSYFEVKPSFDQNNMTRLAKINQKWVFDKHNVLVNIVIPEKLFEKTFTPKNYLVTTKSNKPRKIKYKNIISVDEFLLSSCSEK